MTGGVRVTYQGQRFDIREREDGSGPIAIGHSREGETRFLLVLQSEATHEDAEDLVRALEARVRAVVTSSTLDS